MAAADLSGKVALVSGGSKGIGAAVCTAYRKAGAKIAINYGSDASAAEALVKELGEEHAFAIQANAGSIAGVEKIVAETAKRFGKIDILVPNAGVALIKDVHSTTEEDFDRTYALNVKGPLFLVQKALPHMAKGSRVILVSTSLCANSHIQPRYLLYASSKGAIEQMTRILSKDLARNEIFVNAIAPGPTTTELFMKANDEQKRQEFASQTPSNRLGEPDEVAAAFVFLAGEGARWVSGQVLRVNGGLC